MAQITLNSSGVASSGSLLLQTNGTTTQATLDTSGNLGLGVTPSASSLSGFIEGAYGTFGQTSSLGASISGNAYYNSGWKYKVSSTATLQLLDSGGFKWNVAGSGTAGNAITFTQAMTLDASGNLGVGTTSPSSKLDVTTSSAGRIVNINSTAANGGGLTVQAAGTDVILIGSYKWMYGTGNAGDGSLYANTFMAFGTNGSERARIDSSGNLLVGTTSVLNSGKFSLLFDNSAQNGAVFKGSSTSYNFNAFSFRNSAGGEVGYIYTTGTTTTYSTSSDYRLKNSIEPMTGALAKVALLKPCTYKWNFDGSDGEGFIAHELAEVVPQCVQGQKDGTRIEQYEISPAVPATFDEEGNELTPAVEAVMGEREVPVYQGIDTSFLVATLTAAIQEQQAIIQQLQADVQVLKGQA